VKAASKSRFSLPPSSPQIRHWASNVRPLVPMSLVERPLSLRSQPRFPVNPKVSIHRHRALRYDTHTGQSQSLGAAANAAGTLPSRRARISHASRAEWDVAVKLWFPPFGVLGNAR